MSSSASRLHTAKLTSVDLVKDVEPFVWSPAGQSTAWMAHSPRFPLAVGTGLGRRR